MLSPEHVENFRRYIYHFYERAGRHSLPWRVNASPYAVWVSEVMLQQTQVDRVIPKFHAFLATFPTIGHLATATTADVITAWQGLGYNRRALQLQKAAQVIQRDYNGVMPQGSNELLALPGVGPYTAAAIQAFAFNQPSYVIETNIRTVFIFHFFHESYSVTDDMLEPLVTSTLDHDNPRAWYSALMDYGSYLKQHIGNPTKQSKTYVKQSKFEGSLRQVRGATLKALSQSKNEPLSLKKIAVITQLPIDRLKTAVADLEKEGFIIITKQGVTLRV